MRTDFYVYVLFRNDGSPFYVGKGRGERWLQHERKRTGKTNPILRGILKQENYVFPKTKVQENLSEMEAFATEMALIALMGRRCDGTGPLANLTMGGDGVAGLMWSKASREQASVSARARTRTAKEIEAQRAGREAYWTPEVRQAFGERMKARWEDPSYRDGIVRTYRPTEAHKLAVKVAMSTSKNRARMREVATGRRHTLVSLAKLSVAHKGKKLTEEHKAKIGDAHRGKPGWLKRGDKLTEEHKAAISAGKKGKTNGLEGKKLSEAHKAACSAARKAVIARKKAAGIPDLSGRGRRAKYERMLAEQST